MQQPRFPRSWRALFGAGVISSFGDELTRVALPAQVYAQGGGVTQLAWLGILQTLPFAASSWAGRIADRGWSRLLLIGSDVLRAALLVLVIVSPNWQTVLILAALMQLGTAGFSPAETSVESRLLEPGVIVKANSWRVMTRSGTRVLGPVAAGLLLAFRGAAAAFLVDALTFVASAILIAAFVMPRPVAPPDATAGDASARRVRTPLDPSLRPLLVFQVLMFAVFGVQGPLFYDFAAGVLGAHKEAFGLLMGAASLGSLLGALALERLLRGATAFRQRLLGAVMLFDAAALAMYTFTRTLGPALALMTAMGVIMAVYQIMVRSAIQQLPDESARGRVAGLFSTVATPAMIASLLLASPLKQWAGSTPRALLYAAGVETAAALVLLTWRAAAVTAYRTSPGTA